LAQHDALATATSNHPPGEVILAFLDDLYVVITRARAHGAFREVATAVEKHAGVRTHLRKLRAWCWGSGKALEELAAAEPEAWAASKPDAGNGLVVFGAPLGRRACVEAHAEERMRKEILFSLTRFT